MEVYGRAGDSVFGVAKWEKRVDMHRNSAVMLFMNVNIFLSPFDFDKIIYYNKYITVFSKKQEKPKTDSPRFFCFLFHKYFSCVFRKDLIVFFFGKTDAQKSFNFERGIPHRIVCSEQDLVDAVCVNYLFCGFGSEIVKT